ncbi:unnamed protein product, partial [Rotaria sp. Silwood1]
QFQQDQIQNFRNQLHDYFTIDENLSFDQIPQLIIDQITKDRDDFNQQYEILQKTNDELRSESETNLETIKQSYTNTINELNQELLILKEELEKQTNSLNQQQFIETSKQPFDEIPLDTTISNDENEEVSSIIENNLAWEQVLIEILRNELEDYIPINYNVSINEIVQQIVEEIKKEREQSNERYQALEKANNQLQLELENNMESIRQSYTNTVNELNQELLAMKEQCEQLDSEKQFLTNQLENQSMMINQELDIQQTEKPLNTIDDMNRILENLQNILSLSKDTSIEDIIFHINNLVKDNVLLKEIETSLTKDLEYINQQLIDVDRQCEQLKEHNKELLLKRSTNSIDDDQLQQDYILLENQCIQLDNANRAWQQFYDNQIDLLKNKFKDHLDFHKNLDFDQILQIIATKLDEQNNRMKINIPSETTTTTTNIDVSEKSLLNPEQNNQILNLQEEIQCLEQQLNEDQYLIDSLKNNFQLITQENIQLTKKYDEIQQKNNLLIKDNDNLTNQLNELKNQSFPLDSQQENNLQLSNDHIQRTHDSSIEESPLNIISHVQSSNMKQDNEEIEQLKTNLALVTNQCAQLNEANRAWQQYHQNQLELFHNKLQDLIPLNENSTLEQIAHQISIYLNQLEYDRNLLLQNNNPS